MRKHLHYVFFLSVLLLITMSTAVAKVYWLPDYLNENEDRNDNRTNIAEDKPSSGLSCATYGFLSASEISGMECEQERIASIGVCYKNCVCNRTNFPYSSDNCKGNYAPSGTSCQGEYFSECLCSDRFKYDSSNCNNGYMPSGASCSDNVGTKYEECVDVCVKYEELPDVSDCPYGCEEVVGECNSKCSECYADNCRNRPDNITDYGCQKYWQDCSSKCETGKTCTPTDCSGYTLSSCPANASCESCTPGCGDDTPRYKYAQCNNGYTDLDNYWCSGALRIFLEKIKGTLQ